MNPNSTYRTDVDGLRAVAVLAVVLHHLSALLVVAGTKALEAKPSYGLMKRMLILKNNYF